MHWSRRHIKTVMAILAISTSILSSLPSHVCAAADDGINLESVSKNLKSRVKKGEVEVGKALTKKQKIQGIKQLDDDLKKQLSHEPGFANHYFYYVLDPVLRLAKLSPENLTNEKCNDTRKAIVYTDQAFAAEKSPLLPETEIALGLLDRLCKTP